MKYNVIRNPEYDFLNESYASAYPNLHKYPATMIPQIGVKVLNELN
ncbi:MAG: modification methylase, partial [Gemmatimonadetes bacterium]